MNLDKKINSLKYFPKIWTGLSYPLLLLFSLYYYSEENLRTSE